MSKENINGDYNEGGNLLEKNDHSADLQIRKTGCSPRKGETFLLTDVVAKLETVAERRMRRYSHYVVYCTTFIMSIGFSIILTGVWPYLKQLDPTASKEYLGWVIAANPIGQMLFSPVLGWWANRVGSTRIAFVLTILLSISGSAMYALLPLMGTYASYLIFVSRFIVGLSGANIAICRSYIVASTKLKERTSALAGVAAAQAIGFILGPIIQSAIAYAFSGSTVEDDGTINGNSVMLLRNGIPWNMYSAVGYIGVVLYTLNIFLFSPLIFKDISITTTTDETIQESKEITPDYLAISSLLFSFFVIGFLFVLLESIIVPLVIDIYAYDYKTAIFMVGIGLSILGVLALVVFIIVAMVSRKYQNDRIIYLLFGFVPLTFGILLHMPVGSNYPVIMDCEYQFANDSLGRTTDDLYHSNNSSINTTCTSLGCPYFQEWCFYTPIIEKPQLIVAQLVTMLGYAVAFSLAPPLFSKMLGPQPQGFWMGLLTTIGGSARIIGPIFAVYVYSSFGPRWLFGSLFVLFLLTTFLVSFFYKRLVPCPLGESNREQESIS